MTDKVFLITGNPEKVASAEKAFEQTGIELRQLDCDLKEVQASSSLKVARHTVREVIGQHNRPIIREDHSLYLDAVSGFPGPYLSYFDQKIPAEELLELLDGKKRTGHFEIATVLGFPTGEIEEYRFKVPIKVAEQISGEERNWDRILMLEDAEETFAESESNLRLEVWNKNFRKIAQKLSES